MKARHKKRKLMHRARHPVRLNGIYSLGVMYRLTKARKVVPVRSDREMRCGAFINSTVGFDTVGNVEVSTVFLMVKHGIFEPAYFETALISDTGIFDIVARYATWNEAMAGHRATVEALEGK